METEHRKNQDRGLQPESEPSRGSDQGEQSGDDHSKAASIEIASFRRLDPHAVTVWRIEELSSMGSVFLLALIGGVALWWLTPTPGWIMISAWILLGVILLVSVLWIPPRKYASWSYRADDQLLEIRSGILWQTSVMIPLSRLQHVDMNRGPLDRHFGLASLELHTAGTRAASHKIPCLELEVALSLREKLALAADLRVENEQ